MKLPINGIFLEVNANLIWGLNHLSSLDKQQNHSQTAIGSLNPTKGFVSIWAVYFVSLVKEEDWEKIAREQLYNLLLIWNFTECEYNSRKLYLLLYPWHPEWWLAHRWYLMNSLIQWKEGVFTGYSRARKEKSGRQMKWYALL